MEITIKTDDIMVFEKIKNFVNRFSGVNIIVETNDTYNQKNGIDSEIEKIENGKAKFTEPLKSKADIEAYFSGLS